MKTNMREVGKHLVEESNKRRRSPRKPTDPSSQRETSAERAQSRR
jgi:hypothetical protein